jgi:protein O-mannosyl-transferase
MRTNMSTSGLRNSIPPVILMIFVLVLSIAAYSRNSVWEGELSLWVDVVKKTPSKARGYNNVGNTYYRAGNYEQAWQFFQKALTIDPSYFEAVYNAGTVATDIGQYDEAIRYFTRALTIKKTLSKTYVKRGVAFLRGGDPKSARADFTTACYMADDEGCYNLQQIQR